MEKLFNQQTIQEEIINHPYYDTIKDSYVHLVKLFGESINASLPYHNLQHGKDVAERVLYLFLKHDDFYKIGEENLFNVLWCTMFHDIGYYVGASPKDHELVGSNVFRSIFKNYNNHNIFGSSVFKKVSFISHLIYETKIDIEPKYTLSTIIRDADILHWCFDYEHFIEQNNLIGFELGFGEERNAEFLVESRKFMKNYQLKNPIFDKLRLNNIQKIKEQINIEYGTI